MQYIIEFIKLYIVIRYVVKARKIKFFAKINVLLIISLFMLDLGRFMYNGKVVEYNYDTYVIGILAVMIILYAVGKLKFLPVIFCTYIIICFIDMLVVGFLASGLSISIAQLMGDPFYKVVMNAVSIILYFLISFIIQCIHLNINVEFISRQEIYFIIMVIIGVIGCGLYIAAFQLFGNNVNNSKQGRLLTIGISMGGFAIVGVVVGFIIKENNLKHLKEIQIIQESMLVQQQIYYEKLLQQENETRKFRHDINEHLYCIAYLQKSKKYEELAEYVEALTTALNQIKELSGIDTGFDLVNIILSDLLSQYRDFNIEMKWNGLIPLNIKMANKDLCGLFSNLLKNAFEGAAKCKESRFIEVNTMVYDGDFYIRVNNSSHKTVPIVEGKMITSKKDKSDHGYGIQIIHDIVSRYSGEINFLNDNNNFEAEITFINLIGQC